MPFKPNKINRPKLRAYADYRDGHLYCRVNEGQRKQGDLLGGPRADGYWATYFDGKTHKLHQLVWAWHYDTDAPIINHINENKADNRIENLEAVDNRANILHSLPSRNLPPNVQERCGRYRCVWSQNNRTINTATFDTPEEALEAMRRVRT